MYGASCTANNSRAGEFRYSRFRRVVSRNDADALLPQKIDLKQHDAGTAVGVHRVRAGGQIEDEG